MVWGGWGGGLEEYNTGYSTIEYEPSSGKLEDIHVSWRIFFRSDLALFSFLVLFFPMRLFLSLL